ncbi:MAG: hypothetical protein JNJ60_04710 [Rhodocyclaceae bacterium]|nr:hypothetical protein [Rhodocyclaceae bacterium]
MRLTLALPGLITAPNTNTAARTAMPALAALCGRGQLRWQPALAAERWLAQAFGLDPRLAPFAALRAAGDGLEPGSAHWLAADPAQLMFFHEHLVLAQAPEFPAADAQALLDALNRTFADIGRFEYGAPSRWYLRLARPLDLACATRSEAASRKANRSLPGGADGPAMRRAMNEIQMLLHAHPVNQARVAAGQAQINTVWFWGAGTLTTPPQAPAASVLARDPLALGLAKLSGAHHGAPPDQAQALDLKRDTLVWLEDLAAPAETGDDLLWQQALERLERDWLAPLLSLLQRGKIDSLNIAGLGDGGTLDLQASRFSSWQVWRKAGGPMPPPAPQAD